MKDEEKIIVTIFTEEQQWDEDERNQSRCDEGERCIDCRYSERIPLRSNFLKCLNTRLKVEITRPKYTCFEWESKRDGTSTG